MTSPSESRPVWHRWLLAVVAAAAFCVLTAQVATSGWLTGGDRPTLNWLAAHRAPAWTAIAKAVTNVGGPAGTLVIGLAIAGYLAWRTRRVLPGALVVGVVAIAAAANTAMKMLVGRERPPVLAHLIEETDLSYPSGHVAGTTALVGMVLLVYLASRPGRPRAGIAAAGAVLVVAIVALTRLYLGVHWLSDTVGGALLGATTVLVAWAVLASAPNLDLSARPAHFTRTPNSLAKPGSPLL